ncbi:hypothetical protein ACSLMH_13775 [Flavobacterium columnare]|nr:hypothetical protein [Flavobacterium columnare]ANO47563.1 hypothetical protein Pf1_02108 [Flavobacterium columnare]AUX19022.1 hypothetical protein AQ623_12575 [Flavobacterium columnare]QOH13256.1 hypothetical protein HUE50_04465 [Flavobacterium columnare]QOH23895.1 hypothetical protein GSQ57_04470 [Flavobacterium columnare]GEM57169.1 hypothetical protein FC1_04070 [Flavobacterium columnare NBRC 100251 = ATCC 23463]
MMNEELENDKVEQLVFLVQKRVGKPMSVNVTQAIIESFGIREIDVQNDYGFSTIANLSQVVYGKILERYKDKIVVEKKDRVSINLTKEDLKYFFKDYLVGIFYVLPIFFQVFCVVFFGYSLWVYSDFNILQSTSVVIGVITSLVLTGGVVTVISKQISFYWNHKNNKMVFQTTVYLMKTGFKLLFFVNAIFVLLSFLLEFFAFQMAILSGIYSIFIGSMLLMIAPLYVFKERIIIPVVIILGSAFSLALKVFTPLYIYFTHWIGLGFVVLILWVYLIRFFKKNNAFDPSYTTKDVKNEFIIYNNYMYFFYGMLFFLYVFLDRIIAWSVHEKERFLYFIFFEKDYEIGMDIALLMYLLVAGVFEFGIVRFAKLLDRLQSEVTLDSIQNYGKGFVESYLGNFLLLLLTSCFAFIIELFILYSPYGYDACFEIKLNSINRQVCIIGSLGYFFFSCSVLNVLHFFTLGQPQIPLKSILYSFVINLVFGLFFSRFFSYDLSVVGFLVGNLFFMLFTSYHLYKFFKKMDYYYYASF